MFGAPPTVVGTLPVDNMDKLAKIVPRMAWCKCTKCNFGVTLVAKDVTKIDMAWCVGNPLTCAAMDMNHVRVGAVHFLGTQPIALVRERMITLYHGRNRLAKIIQTVGG